MDENLVKPHPRDEVLIGAQIMRKKQEVVRAEKLRADLEKEIKRKKAEEDEKLRLKKHRMKINYEHVSFWLAAKYLKLNNFYFCEYYNSLSLVQRNELEAYVYERAKKFFWLKTILFVVAGLTIPVFGWGWLFFEALHKDSGSLPYYKFVSMRDWYRKEFGQTNYGLPLNHTPINNTPRVIPDLRD